MFLELTDYLDSDKSGKVHDKQLFRIANDKLTAFSKTQQAWGVCLDAMKTSLQGALNEFQLFLAASILKNKMMFDFVALKT